MTILGNHPVDYRSIQRHRFKIDYFHLKQSDIFEQFS